MSTNGTIQSAVGLLERLATLRVLVAYLGEFALRFHHRRDRHLFEHVLACC